MNKGLFITFEGGEGAGKTTVIQTLADKLSELGRQILVTREPGGISIAEQIREVILNPDNTMMDGRTEALLYAAARRQHLVEKVSPALASGHIVLCDRFIDSSLAYQGVARGLGLDDIWKINQFAIDSLMPDITIYLDISPEVGLARIAKTRGHEINRLDLEAYEFHERVRQGYLQLAEKYPQRIVKVNAETSEAEVFQQVFQIIEAYFDKKR